MHVLYIVYNAQEEHADRCGDGEFHNVRYFKCEYGKAFFCPVTRLRADKRFATGPSTVQKIDTEKQALELKLANMEKELKIKTRELEVKSRDLATAERSKKEFEKKAADAKTALSSKVSFLVNALQGKTKELAAHNTEVWRIPTSKVTTHKKIGTGGWGEVLEGTVRVAVKKLHDAITFPKHIEKMEREMKLLAEVRHPNLVQFIGAIFDDPNQADHRTPPRIVTELLDMNLRQVGFQIARLCSNLFMYIHSKWLLITCSLISPKT